MKSQDGVRPAHGGQPQPCLLQPRARPSSHNTSLISLTIGLLEMKAMAANRLRSSNQDGSGQLIGKVAVRTASRSSRLSLVQAELGRFITPGWSCSRCAIENHLLRLWRPQYPSAMPTPAARLASLMAPLSSISLLVSWHGFQAIGTNDGPTPERPETPPDPSAFVPFSRDQDFVERGDLLDQIHRKCAVPGSRTALVGLGGVG